MVIYSIILSWCDQHLGSVVVDIGSNMSRDPVSADSGQIVRICFLAQSAKSTSAIIAGREGRSD